MVRACVIGYPVRHSRSPLIHGHWLRSHGISGSYERIEVAPEALASFLAGLSERGLVGGNVTLPHKEAVFGAARVTDPVALALRAINTLWLDGTTLCGENTDVFGFLANLDGGAPGWDAELGRVAVIGAGGAARAVVHALLDRGAAEICIFNRTAERARSLASLLGPRLRAADWSDLGALLAGSDLLVNTTSLGMAGQPALDLDLSTLPAEATVCDIVYVPLETRLLRQARARGLRAVDGLGMLLHQAVPGFERWFGVRPQVTAELRDLIIKDIEHPGGQAAGP
jgi:shikimate dehydrogenase